MKIAEILREIDYASGIMPLNVDIKDAIKVGDIDNHPAWSIEDSNVIIYFFTNAGKISAYIAISKTAQNGYRAIVRMANISAPKGSITALIAWVISTLSVKLKLSNDESLTIDSMQWLSKLIKSGGRGFTITDQTGKIPDVIKLHREWEYARQNYISGPTTIYIENKNIKLKSINENSLLSPCMKFIGDDIIE